MGNTSAKARDDFNRVRNALNTQTKGVSALFGSAKNKAKGFDTEAEPGNQIEKFTMLLGKQQNIEASVNEGLMYIDGLF